MFIPFRVAFTIALKLLKMASLKLLVYAAIAVFFIPTIISGNSFLSNLTNDNIQSFPTIAESLRAKLIHAKDTDIFPIMIEFKGGNRKALKDFREDPIYTRKGVPRGERIQNLVTKLEENALQSQADVTEFLSSKNVVFKQFWITNEIFVTEASSEVIRELENFDEIARIRSPIGGTTPEDITTVKPPNWGDLWPSSGSQQPPQDIPQPIQQINGRCPEINCLGDGVVVAVLDAGVLQTHVEIKDNWRQDYGWFDPYYSTLAPGIDYNDDSQGTSAVGIITGKSVGVAPNAQWIFCTVYPWDEGSLKACTQWALCPTLPDGSGMDCSKAPDIISNNWVVNGWNLEIIPRDTFYGVQAAWNEAGIISFLKAGDYGPYCSSIESPAMYDISFAVGTVDNSSKTTYFSARGPVLNEDFPNLLDPNSGMGTCRGNCVGGGGWGGWSGEKDLCTLIKPDLTAPGNKINTSTVDSDTSYGFVSSTALSTSYVSGVAALMVCANRQNNHGWGRRLDWWTTGNILKETANRDRINTDPIYENVYPNSVAWESNLLCNKMNGIRGFPNNIYGWGEVDACGAVWAVKNNFRGL